MLDCDFTVDKVKRAINTLKCGKGGGKDLLIPEMFIECKDSLSPILCKSVYPSNWSMSVIVTVPKKGDNSDVNNYRGITLTIIFSKMLSIMLEKRLRDWVSVSIPQR